MSADRKDVHLRLPAMLVDKADAFSDIDGRTRTSIIATALREYLAGETEKEQVKQDIAAAYYDDRLTFDEVVTILGAQEAQTLQVLKQQLEDDTIAEGLAQKFTYDPAAVAARQTADHSTEPDAE